MTADHDAASSGPDQASRGFAQTMTATGSIDPAREVQDARSSAQVRAENGSKVVHRIFDEEGRIGRSASKDAQG